MKGKDQGFILVLVLWVLLALTVSVSALALWVSQSTDLAIDQSNEIRAQADRFATRETLKFLLATRPSRASGLYLGSEPRQLARTFQANPFVNMRARGSSSDLHYDGSKYRGLGDTTFAIQDEAGLIGVNLFDADDLEAVLGQLGVTFSKRNRLVQRLLEYKDYLPNPARDAEYRASDRPPPPARNLLSELEVRLILEWEASDPAWDVQRLLNYVTAFRGGSVNLNTAPKEVLSVLPAFGAMRADRVIEARQQGGLASLQAVGRLFNRDLDPLTYRFLPSDTLRVILGDGFTKRALRYTVRLTGSRSAARPWRVELVHPVRGADFDAASAQVVAQPLLAESPEPDAR